MTKQAYFENNIALNEASALKVSSRLKFVGILRVSWFLSFLVVFVYLINIRMLAVAIFSFFVFVLVFGLLVILYNKLSFKLKHHRFLGQINQHELNRLSNIFEELETGAEFSDTSHVYAADLDLFGEKSVFQLINRTSTRSGKQLMANRLLGQELPSDHSKYQDSVRELAKKPEVIQQYQALGMHLNSDENNHETFSAWLNDSESLKLIGNRTFLLLALPILTVIGFIIATVMSITYYSLLPIVLINFLLLARNHQRTSLAVEQTSSVVDLLKTYLRHIRLINDTKLQTDFNKQLKVNLKLGGKDAEKEIKKLSGLLDQLQSRTNLLHIFINIPFLLDLQWMMRLNAWKNNNREDLNAWMDTLAEFEVLVSLAGLTFLYPNWAFPTLVEDEYKFDGEALGHPLITTESRITNDFSISGEGKSIIITGPNMAGKSTFLRTLALNVILAQMGSPICGNGLTVSKKMKVFTAMRTQDNLSENISSFYAELDRIKFLLKEIDAGVKVFYFLDELLKGTNSADRHRGADALVRQLISLGVTGFVSTHDIELGEITKQLEEVTNYSVESTITNGEINFDYKVREGICSSFNASELMRQMGIKV